MLNKELIKKILTPRFILALILIYSAVVRLAGIKYGLPLWLFDDEPPFALAALKMIQLKTLLPVLHLDEFRTILYYPPYLSYLYLLPFSVLLAVKYLFFHGGMGQFLYYLTSDLSHFFLTARFINVVLAVASVALIYSIAKNIFKNEFAGLLAAFLLGTSLFHILLSFTSRHWLPVSFLFILGLWFLTNPDLSFRKRHIFTILTAGVGMGVSTIMSLLMILIFYWYFFREKIKIKELLKEKYFYLAIFAFILLAVLPTVLYPRSQGFRADLTIYNSKSVWGLIQSPFGFLRPVALSEPILIAFAVIGLIFAFWKQQDLFWPLFLFIYTYSGIFYLFFRYEHRFTMGLFPLLVISAAYGILECYQGISNNIFSKVLIFILLSPLVIFSLRLSHLAYHDDSRIHLRNWALENLPAGSKILVYARLTRLPSDKEAIREQAKIDTASLRKVDFAEENFSGRRDKSFHALNFYSVSNPEFYRGIKSYAASHSYQYLFMSQADFFHQPENFKNFEELANSGKLLKFEEGAEENYSLAISQLIGSPLNLFKIKEFGPPIGIYKLF